MSKTPSICFIYLYVPHNPDHTLHVINDRLQKIVFSIKWAFFVNEYVWMWMDLSKAMKEAVFILIIYKLL